MYVVIFCCVCSVSLSSGSCLGSPWRQRTL